MVIYTTFASREVGTIMIFTIMKLESLMTLALFDDVYILFSVQSISLAK